MANIPNLPFSGADLHTALTELNQQTGGEGASAYDVAVSNGFTGTEAQWLASLRGTDGADGAQGPQGPAGAKGDTGEAGPAGADGADGADAEIISFATDAEAQAYSTANPGAAVFSTEVI